MTIRRIAYRRRLKAESDRWEIETGQALIEYLLVNIRALSKHRLIRQPQIGNLAPAITQLKHTYRSRHKLFARSAAYVHSRQLFNLLVPGERGVTDASYFHYLPLTRGDSSS